MAERKPKPSTKPPAVKKPAAKPKPKTRRVSTRAKQATSPAAKERADAAAAAAREAKALGRRKTAAQAQLRDSLVIARKAQGLTNAVIAAEVGVTERTIERILKARRELRSPLDDSPMRLLEDLTVGYRLAIGDYEAMAMAWFDVNQSASLGAKKAADETRARLAALLANVGKLPSNLELFRSEMAMQRIAEEMVAMMRAVAAGERDASEAVEFFRGLLAEGERRPQITAGG